MSTKPRQPDLFPPPPDPAKAEWHGDWVFPEERDPRCEPRPGVEIPEWLKLPIVDD